MIAIIVNLYRIQNFSKNILKSVSVTILVESILINKY